MLFKSLWNRKERKHKTSSLAECFEFARDDRYTHDTLSKNRAHEYFVEGGRMNALCEFIESDCGISEFEYIGCGDNAIVLRYSSSQVLRFRAPALPGKLNTQGVIKSPLVCPLWKEITVEGGRVNFIPYVESLAVAKNRSSKIDEQAKSMIYTLILAGFREPKALWFYDYCIGNRKDALLKFEQVGLMPDGTPIIIDHGAVVEIASPTIQEQIRMKEDKEIANDWLAAERRLSYDWLDSDGQPKADGLPKPDQRIMRLPDFA